MIRNRLVASLTVLFLLGGWPERAEASSVKGYMITLHQDTIYGRIQLPWMLSSMDFFNLFGFDYVSMSCQVFFKSEAEKSYHRYTPLMISGYGFVHRRTIYIYKSFDLKYKSILEDKSKGFRFLNLIHAGTVDLYRYPITITYPIQSTIDRGREMM
ncbi:MAG: hypothetical protein Q8914_13065, partial [Bacteroidota bacterium]|nr:hypothetical protein [Bacteroidota bacterium]